MKKLTALLLSLAMVFALAACGGTTATPSSSAPASSAPVSSAPTEVAAGGNIGICIYKFDDNFMTVYRNQLQKVLEEKGYKVTIADGNNDQAKQTEQINTFISQKVDALIINPVQSTAASSIINLVKEANIPTVLINREPSAEDLDLYDKLSYVGADASQSGSFQGQDDVHGLVQRGITSTDVGDEGTLALGFQLGESGVESVHGTRHYGQPRGNAISLMRQTKSEIPGGSPALTGPP